VRELKLSCGFLVRKKYVLNPEKVQAEKSCFLARLFFAEFFDLTDEIILFFHLKIL